MKFFAETLWDLLGLAKDRPRPRAAEPSTRRQAMRDRYDTLVREMKAAYGLRVRRWRTSTSGCAWIVRSADGSESRLLEAPYPRGPVSCAVFLHEVGHHAIGFGTYSLRCLEEYHAWGWALATMRARGFNVTAAVERRMDEAVRYALRKARHRGLRRVPPELATYLQRPGTVPFLAE